MREVNKREMMSSGGRVGGFDCKKVLILREDRDSLHRCMGYEQGKGGSGLGSHSAKREIEGGEKGWLKTRGDQLVIERIVSESKHDRV